MNSFQKLAGCCIPVPFIATMEIANNTTQTQISLEGPQLVFAESRVKGIANPKLNNEMPSLVVNNCLECLKLDIPVDGTQTS
jgi:hypothetical protein